MEADHSDLEDGNDNDDKTGGYVISGAEAVLRS
jgi:hypothetical protein